MTNPEFKEATIQTLKTLAKTKGIKFYLKYSDDRIIAFSKESMLNLTNLYADQFVWIPAEKYGNVVYLIADK